MPSIRGLIFDLDGTLADNMPHTLDCFRSAFVASGYPAYSDDELLASKLGTSQEEIFQTHAANDPDLAFATFIERYTAGAYSDLFRIEGMDQLLEWAVSSGLRLGLVTGGGLHVSEITLELLGYRRHFSEISANAIPAVPKAVRMVALAQGWNLPVESIASIDDMPSGMRTAIDIGMIPLGAAWQRVPVVGLTEAGAAATFAHPSALRAWLEAYGCG